MCGIAGFIDTPCDKAEAELRATVLGMADALRHRGPDDGGAWVDAAAGVALGHRRLAVIDLSPEGRQPMPSACGRYVIVFNGEIYNFADLRRELAGLGHRFRGHSDTEVMLAAISRWGVEPAVERFNGMFAFALWDRRERRLVLARDRLGEKPLYYGWTGGVFLFGSELKALRAHPAFRGEVDRDALALYLRHNYIPTPYAIYKGVFKLPPGTMLTVDPRNAGAVPEPKPYWSARAAAERGVAEPYPWSEAEAADELDGRLREAVRLRMVADVPLGAFLSGGIDSSTVVALMQAQSGRPVKTFSIGFREAGYDEAEHARAVARHLGTDHTELYVTPEEAMAVIPRLPALYDEPFSDSSQIPTFLVSELARRHVTVSLSGDGGDELFGGYGRYLLCRDLWRRIGWLPAAGRRAVAAALAAVAGWMPAVGPRGAAPRVPDGARPAPRVPDGAFVRPDRLLSRYGRPGRVGDKLRKLAEVLAADSPEALYRRLVSHWKAPDRVVPGAVEPPTALTDRRRWADVPELVARLMYLDTISYLPDDILVKVDRASMGVSLEARVPLLDHRLVEFAWRLPLAMKIRDGQGKWLLRQVLYRYVPKELVDRPKMGFGVPIGAWLRGPLRDWAESLLDERRLRQEGYFDPRPIREKWMEHLSGKHDWQYYLWDILMFQAWLEEERGRRPADAGR